MSDDHLNPSRESRGFANYPPILSLYGGSVRVVESSLATEPAIWLFVRAPANLNEPLGEIVEVPAHLSAANAKRLMEQIAHALEHHYQGDASNEPDYGTYYLISDKTGIYGYQPIPDEDDDEFDEDED